MDHPREDWAVGDVLARWCSENDVSQRELAKRAGISEKHLSRIITGNGVFSVDVAVRLAEATGMSAIDLFRLQNDELVRIAIRERHAAVVLAEQVLKQMLNTPPIKNPKQKTPPRSEG
jgi:plasmid maintenance system antidote protein VapI